LLYKKTTAAATRKRNPQGRGINKEEELARKRNPQV